MILKIFLERFFAKMAYWLYSFKNYFRVIAVRRPKSSAVDSTVTKTNSATGGLSANGDGFEKSSDQCGMSQSDKDVLGYCDVWNDWMIETLAEMQKLRRGATAEGDFNRQSFAQQMITRIRNVKTEIANAQGVLCCYKKSAEHQKILNLLPSVRHQLDNLQ